jgi:hypothetical protein
VARGVEHPPQRPARPSAREDLEAVAVLDARDGRGLGGVDDDAVACVLAEPIMTNVGMVLADDGYHAALRDLTRKTGTLLIIGSLYYSLRKRHWATAGDPKTLLKAHEFAAWLGSLLVLIHAGIHFNAVLAWLALLAMLVNVASGLTGKYLLAHARIRLIDARARLTAQGLDAAAIDERLHRDSLTMDLVRKWRVVHVPITLAFAVLATAHLVATALFWDWQ